jgi:hypothetical protein
VCLVPSRRRRRRPAGDRLLTRHPDRLTEDERLRLKAILEQCPELRAAAEHVRCFGAMLTKLGATSCRRGSPPSVPTPTACPGWARLPLVWSATWTR